jgi:hypothetical protein
MYKRKSNVRSILKYPQNFLSMLNIDFDSYIRYSLNTRYVYRGADKFLAPPIGGILVLYIQGVQGGTDNTSGGCSLGQTIPI